MSEQKQKAQQNLTLLEPEGLTVVPLRHPMRVVAIAVVITGMASVAYSVFTNPEFQWSVVGHYMLHPLILNGLLTTLTLTIVIMILAVATGTVMALMMLSPSKMLSLPANAFVWFFRGAPALVQLILWYNLSLVFKNVTLWVPGIGTIFSIPTNDIMTPITAAIIALSLHEAGYMAEIVRGGLKSVAKGQTEAAASLGMKPGLLTRRIILPQAMRMIIPPTGNETINLLKMTSLVSIIAVDDILYSAQSVYARTFETMPLLLVVAIWYLIIVSIMSIGQYHLECYFSRDELRAGRMRKKAMRDIVGNVLTLRRKEIVA
ncbi:amino acid ABC transporter permease [Mesorhizobium sp. M6A.T.Cr.TU.016.01.1.1]|uniref:amino acid ABC transporter permease n=1 Tax=Mesorhizobium sp. M6A.T.Cr.TU.016.01.1.1 TaxID=2493677 RepID=UPI000F765BED|nr:amino acid ABC transporter permease [Mesorhizobium sp. M6A.T.Cr.TU.016.01.1.1]AZO68065.1 amino acid ABC transporter permease [Mesorhizobium sp. M6A.T.Cr.TU.016.01.1.1]